MINENVLAEIAFKEDDFQLRGVEETKLDMNFASQSFWKDAMLRFRKNRSAMFSLSIILLIVLLAIFGPIISPYTYQETHITDTNMAPRVQGAGKFGHFHRLRNAENLYRL